MTDLSNLTKEILKKKKTIIAIILLLIVLIGIIKWFRRSDDNLKKFTKIIESRRSSYNVFDYRIFYSNDLYTKYPNDCFFDYPEEIRSKKCRIEELILGNVNSVNHLEFSIYEIESDYFYYIESKGSSNINYHSYQGNVSIDDGNKKIISDKIYVKANDFGLIEKIFSDKKTKLIDKKTKREIVYDGFEINFEDEENKKKITNINQFLDIDSKETIKFIENSDIVKRTEGKKEKIEQFQKEEKEKRNKDIEEYERRMERE